MIQPDTANIYRITSSRRAFVRGTAVAASAFILGCHLPFANRVLAQGASTQPTIDPNVFLRIGPDNSVTIISKHFEMGQGVTTGLATLVAEELDADWSTIRFEFAPNNAKLYANLIFGVMATGGTTSMANSWEQMRTVGAAARMMFITAAAQKWGVSATGIQVENGVVSHAGSGQRASFGDLASDAMLVAVPTEVTLKQPTAWKLIGTRIPRLDSAGKTTGTATFALDIRRPEMLTALVKRPDLFGAAVASFDATEAKKVEGVVDVVQIPTGVAVLATDT